jgi:hypothetical protein
VLDIVVDEVHMRKHLFHVLVGHVARGLDRGIHATIVSLGQESGDEVRREHALAAANRDTAA